jgi:hypothetical protein
MISSGSRAGAFTAIWTSIGVVAAVGVAVITTIAAVDHARKTRALHRADVAAWYCAHRGQHCDERKSDDIEDSWSARERVYKDLGVSFVVISLGVIAVRRLRR